MEGEIESDEFEIAFELVCFILWEFHRQRKMIRDLSPTSNITTHWTRPAILFSLPNKSL